MNNIQIAEKLEQVADLLEFTGANPFRVRAYRNGARVIRDLTQSISSMVEAADRPLTELQGIGKDLAEKLTNLVSTGKLPILDELLQEVPKSVLSLLRIAGLGPKKAAVLYKELNITTLEMARAACEAGEVRKLKGFAEKTEKLILAGIDLAAQADQRIKWSEADLLAQQLLAHLQQAKSIQKIQMAGSYRRGKETVGDLDVLVVADDVPQVMDCFGQFDGVENVLGRGDTKMSIRLESGFQIDLRIVPPESFGVALQYFTGSKDHNVKLRGMAKSKGLKINEYGVYRDEEYLAGATEQEVYATLNLPLFPPELREARREFQWAEAGELPQLIELCNIQGDLHMHTTATDGKATIQQMIDAAKQRGLKYIAITDHSKRVTMASGLDSTRLRAQWLQIDKINQSLGDDFTVLKGIECDILENGEMDLPDDVLAEADWVVASIHYGQNQPREQITARIIGALENPNVSAIAHPTGRLINRRKAYEVDLDAVYKAAAKQGKFLELNANPARLDLDDIACAAAKEHGIQIVINSDAHRIEGLDVMRYGIMQARRAGLTKDDVANSRSWESLKNLLDR